MEITQDILNKALNDIKRIDNSINSSRDELLRLHRELDGYYQVCIKDWQCGLFGESTKDTPFNYYMLQNDEELKYVKPNLVLMKSKIQAFVNGLNIADNNENSSNQVTINNANSNEININLTYQDARNKVEDMTSLTNEETQELLDKINEIEETLKANNNKKSKWEKLKPILAWISDKSFDVAMVLLPLIMNVR